MSNSRTGTAPAPPSNGAGGARGPRRRLLFVVLAAAVAVALLVTFLVERQSPAGSGTPAPSAGAVGPGGWTTVWRDDFTGAKGQLPSGRDWLFDQGHGYQGGAADWGTNEVQSYTGDPANVSLDGRGDLAITPLRSASGKWTSARIETRRTDFRPPAGGVLRFESRIKLPDVTGAAAAGYWPAFWALGAGERTDANAWPGVGELDFLENVNGDNRIHGTFHCGIGQGGPCNEKTGLGATTTCQGSACQGVFHTYALEWDRSTSPEQLRWYVDDRLYWTVRSSDVDARTWAAATTAGDFIVLNVAMGGDFPNGVAGRATPDGGTRPGVPMLVDYVAVYAHQGAAGPAATATTAAAGTDATGRIQAAKATSHSGTATVRGSTLASISQGDSVEFAKLGFGGGAPLSKVTAVFSSGVPAGAKGKIEFRLDSPTSPTFGSIDIPSTGGWQSWQTLTQALHTPATGVHNLYLTFVSDQKTPFLDLATLSFSR